MKLATAFLIIGALQISLLLFSGQHVDSNPFLDAALNPTSFNTLLTMTIIGALAAGIAFGGAFVGSFILNKPDLVVFGGMIGIFFSWMTPIVSLWRVITTESIWGTEISTTVGGITTTASNLVAAVIILPFIIMMFTTLLTWWRSTFEG